MTEPLRVLYLHPFAVHGGATKSLLEMYNALPPGAVKGRAVVPPGVATRMFESAGMEIVSVRGIAQLDDTRFGHYRGLRWLILLRELALWPGTIIGLRAARARGPADVIHCNEITALLAGIYAKRLLGAPLLVHVRSLQRSDASAITCWLRDKLRRHADAIVAIDQAVRRTLPADLPVEIIHNGMKVTDVTAAHDPTAPFCVAIIGVLHRSKGVYELVEAVRLLRDRGVRVRLLVVGSNVHELTGLRGWLLRKLDFARDVRAELEALVEKHALRDLVEFTGFVKDVAGIYARVNAVCFPSHLDAPGRPVFEAALHGVPAIVAMRNPTDDVISHGVTGLCIEEPLPPAIADAIELLVRDRGRARDMGAAARHAALTRFDSRISAERVLECYRRLAARRPGK